MKIFAFLIKFLNFLVKKNTLSPTEKEKSVLLSLSLRNTKLLRSAFCLPHTSLELETVQQQTKEPMLYKTGLTV